MKSLIVVFGLLITSVSALAQAPQPSKKTRSIYANLNPLNLEMRYERDSSQHMVDRRPLNLSAGLRKGSSTWLFEYVTFSETTGNATLSIDRQHREYMFWWKENLINLELVDFYVSAGLGAYDEKVTTKLAGSSDAVDTSGLQMMGGASGGVQTKVAGYFLLSLEARILAGKNFDPNPQTSLLARLGIEF
jgi:hypothetical protein